MKKFRWAKVNVFRVIGFSQVLDFQKGINHSIKVTYQKPGVLRRHFKEV